MSNLSDNQFELSIPPIHTPRPVQHSHSVSEPPEQKGLRVARETMAESRAYPFAKVGPVMEPEKVIEHKKADGSPSWTQRVPEARTVTPPLFVMPHELAYHSHLGDLGVEDSHLDSHGIPRGELNENDTPHDLMMRKLHAPHPDSSDVSESVKKHGIKVPVDVNVNKMGELTLYDGHHRVAAALHHRPNEPVPIDWENVGPG